MIWLGRLAPIGLVALGALVAAFLAKVSPTGAALGGAGRCGCGELGCVAAGVLAGSRARPRPRGSPCQGLARSSSAVGTALLGVATAGLTLARRRRTVRDGAGDGVRISGNSGDSQSESFRPGGRVCAGLEPGRMGRRAGGTSVRAVASASSRRGPGGADPRSRVSLVS